MPNRAQDKAQSWVKGLHLTDKINCSQCQMLSFDFFHSHGEHVHTTSEEQNIYKSHSLRGFILKVICFLQDWI